MSSVNLDLLSTQEQWQLLDDLLAKLSLEADAPVPEWHREILDERLALIRAGKVEYSPVAESFARVRKLVGIDGESR